MKNSIIFCLIHVILVIRLGLSDRSKEYTTYRMGSASSLMSWIDEYGFLTTYKYEKGNGTELTLDLCCLADLPEYSDKFRNLTHLTVTYNDINWTKTVEFLSQTKNLVSLTINCVTEENSQADDPDEFDYYDIINQKEFLDKLEYLNIGGYCHLSPLGWLKYTKIKQVNLQNLHNSNLELLYNYLPNTVQAIDFGRKYDYLLEHLYVEKLSRLSIKMLGLARLNLTAIPYGLTNISNGLQNLSLHGNKFEDALIDRPFLTKEIGNLTNLFQFPYLPELLELDLRNCGLKVVIQEMFANMPKLRKLSLAQNKIVFTMLGRLDTLEYLDISTNNRMTDYTIQAELNDEKTFKNYVKNPVFVDLSYSYLILNTPFVTEKTTHIMLSHTGTQCFSIGQNLTSLQVLYINSLQIKQYCYSSLLLNVISAKNIKEIHLIGSNLYDKDIMNFTKDFKQLRVLVLKGNHLESINNLQTTVLTSLETLDLSYNNLMTWKSKVLYNNNHLRELNLSSNKLTMITNEMLNDFKFIEKLDISKNPLICNDFLLHLISQYKKPNFQLLYSADNFCLDDKRFLSYDDFLDCNTEKMATTFYMINSTFNAINENTNVQLASQMSIYEESNLLFYIMMMIVIILSTSSVIIYTRWYSISYYLTLIKISKGTILFKRDLKIRLKSFHYDIFISYAEHDRAWVLEQLLPQLESNGAHFCLHERDFQVGLSILENIMDNMNRSRCLLLIISKSFIKSRWCQFEMNLAQFFLVEMRDRQIILVFLEQIPKTERPKLLHYLMSTKTYLEWPEDKDNYQNDEINRFFKRLNLALQYKSRTQEV